MTEAVCYNDCVNIEEAGHKLPSLASALEVAELLWPTFVREHGCVFLARDAGSNPPPVNDTATGWEAFVNHTHIFDVFSNEATATAIEEETDNLAVLDYTYDDSHPDFVRASKLGRMIARLWSIKLKADFPNERFRVYYTQYDNPIVRFHMVRPSESFWLDDQAVLAPPNRSLEDALIYDTKTGPILAHKKS